MFECNLFLGFKIDAKLSKELSQNSPTFLELFIQNHHDYLQKVNFNDAVYLGKLIGDKIELSNIELIKNNIHSLVSRLAPNYPIQQSNLELFSLIQTQA